MKKQEIIELIKSRLWDLLSDLDIEDIHAVSNVKNNNVRMNGISIKLKDSPVAPCVYIDRYIDDSWKKKEDYEENEITLEMVSKNLSEEFRCLLKEIKEHDLPTVDCQEMKDRVTFELINYEENKERLKDLPHRKFQDLAVIYRINVKMFERQGSVVITNSILKKMKMNEDELFELAYENTKTNSPSVLMKLDDVIRMLNPCIEVPVSPFYYLSNAKAVNGSVMMLYDDILDKVYDEIKEDFYIVPSSINELLIIAISECQDEDSIYLKNLLIDVNDSILDRCDILSYSIYKYSGKFKTLSVAV